MSNGEQMAAKMAGAQAPANSQQPQGKSATAAIIGAVGTAVAAAISGYSAWRANRANRDLMHEQNQWNLDQWNRENSYNLPSSQIARLKAAGLNPSLIYGNGGIMNEAANSVPAADAPTMRPELTIDPLTASQVQLNEAQAQSIKDANKRENEKQPITLESLSTSVEETRTSIQQMKELIEGIKSDNIKKAVEAEISRQTQEAAIQSIKDEYNMTHEKARYFVLSLLTDIGLKESEEELNRAKVLLTEAEEKQVKKLTRLAQLYYDMDKEEFDAIQPYLKLNAEYQSSYMFNQAFQSKYLAEISMLQRQLLDEFGSAEEIMKLISMGFGAINDGTQAVNNLIGSPRRRGRTNISSKRSGSGYNTLISD